MKTGNIAIYQNEDGTIKLSARVEDETIWLNQAQIVALFQSSKSNISEHISQIIKEGELDDSAVRKFRITESDGKNYNVKHYDLDMIISVGYRVKSKIATKFRKWATQTLRNYIVQGYVLNDQRLLEKSKQLEILKNAIILIERGISNQIDNIDQARALGSFLGEFAKGLELIDDYDHERLDQNGKTKSDIKVIKSSEFLEIIQIMKQEFNSNIFGLPKDKSFESSISQIYQSFGDVECYPTIEEKAAMLLYLIVKNHSFIDGNKRIAAACFLYFLEKNGILKPKNGKTIIDNNTLFALTILVAESTPTEMGLIKNVIITILNR